jgi:hypothetical protein
MLRNSQDFIIEIEKIVRNKTINYFEALTIYIEKYEVDPELIASIVKKNPQLKAKIAEDCKKLNLLQKI